MHLLSTLLLGISTNLDNMLIGISFGLRQKRITLRTNLIIGLFSAAATYLFCLLSSVLSSFGRTPNLAGGTLIAVIGLYSILNQSKDSRAADTSLDWRETVILSGCLALNCVPVAFGAGLTGIAPLSAAVSVGIISVVTVALGNQLALRAVTAKLRQWPLEFLGGLIMIMLGITELFI